eukprot:4266026-Amphidinium_carterae.1
MSFEENGSLGLTSVVEQHPQLDGAEVLLRRVWICPVPLLEEAPRDVALKDQVFTEVMILAVHWEGEIGSPIDYCLLAVPEVSGVGVSTMSQSFVVPLEGSDGVMTGHASVTVFSTGGSFVSEKLLESVPRESTVQFFSTDHPGHAPQINGLLSQLVWPPEFVNGTTANLSEHGGEYSLHVTRSGMEEHYQSAGEFDPGLDPRHLVGLGMLVPYEKAASKAKSAPKAAPVPKSVKRLGSTKAPSIIGGVGGKASLVGAVLHPPPPVGSAPKGKSVSPGPKQSPRRRDDMQQLMEMVSSLAERMGRIEQNAHSEQVAAAAAPAQGFSHACMPGMQTMNMLTAGNPAGICPAQSPPPGHLLTPSNMAIPTTSLLQPGRVLGAGLSCGGAPGGSSLLDAQRALASIGGPGGLAGQGAQGMEDLTGGIGRRRARDTAIRMAVERGGQDAQNALQLATLEALERIQSGRQRVDDPLDLLGGEGDLDGELQKLSSGVRGVYGPQRIMQSIEQQPLRWCTLCDEAMARSLGTHTSGMPWSAARYGAERIRFQRFPELERFWCMMACLHALHRAGQYDLMGARVSQFLKSIEQTVCAGGSWRMSWTLTGLPDPRPGGGVHQGLATPAEIAASMQWVKDTRAVDEIIKKELGQGGQAQGGPGGQGEQNKRPKPFKGGKAGPQNQDHPAPQ